MEFAMPTINIANMPGKFPASKGSILDAALEAGVPLPHACRAGTCGTCKCRLLSGEVDMGDDSSLALNRVERVEGLILPCRSRPRTDVTLEVLGEVDNIVYPVRKRTGRVIDVAHLTHDITRVRLELEGMPLTFAAGQYVELTFGRLPARPYSMANQPNDPLLEFHIRHVPNGAVSGYVAEKLQVGERVRFKGPYGSVYWHGSHNGSVVAIAGGSGLAPIKSIIEMALSSGFDQDMYLYFGVRDERDIYYERELLGLARKYANFRFTPVLSTPSGPTPRRTGWVHAAVAADLIHLGGRKLYLAGPPSMVEAATAMAIEREARPKDIHADAFSFAEGSRTPGSGRRLFSKVSRLLSFA